MYVSLWEEGCAAMPFSHNALQSYAFKHFDTLVLVILITVRFPHCCLCAGVSASALKRPFLEAPRVRSNTSLVRCVFGCCLHSLSRVVAAFQSKRGFEFCSSNHVGGVRVVRKSNVFAAEHTC